MAMRREARRGEAGVFSGKNVSCYVCPTDPEGLFVCRVF
jgi:hypothetical protein